MKLFRPSDLSLYLDELGASPQKRLSQHFLIDGNVIENIVRTAAVQEGDCILEIGPGPGALTEALLKKGALVIAIEKDPLFAQGLPRISKQLIVIQGDILALDLTQIVPCQKAPFKVIANLPYQITTPILAALLPRHDLFSTLTLMVQKEVGERMAARPKESHYSRLSLFTAAYCKPKLCFTVSANSFYPKPKVSSCVMHLALHPPPQVSSIEGLFKLIKTAFSQKRKMVRSSLRQEWSKEVLETTLQQLHLSSNSRPQELSLTEWITLFEALPEKKSTQ